VSQRDAHESYAVAARRLHWVAAILAVSLAGIVLLMYVLAHTWLRTTSPPIATAPSSPRLQANPAADLAAERRREEGMLEGYAWVDRERGVARIPVQRAMEILARGSGDASRKSGQPR
jgi:hypothetical protein